MTQSDQTEWTIGELGQQVADALSVDYAGSSNGQVRAVPDRRSIRYYTGLGLLDRPLSMRGRTALYGRRHLQQLVAIKRLQAGGLSLAQIQTRLAGTSDRQLSALARIPRVPAKRAAKRSQRDGFWRAIPDADIAPPPAAAPAPRRQKTGSPPVDVAEATNLIRFQLAPGVSLLVETERGPTADDNAAIAAAAQQLLHQLDNRGLLTAK